jgi:hypothetical protein
LVGALTNRAVNRENKEVASEQHVGLWRSLGARFHGMEEVVGSIPTRSTKFLNNLADSDRAVSSPPTQAPPQTLPILTPGRVDRLKELLLCGQLRALTFCITPRMLGTISAGFIRNKRLNVKSVDLLANGPEAST